MCLTYVATVVLPWCTWYRVRRPRVTGGGWGASTASRGLEGYPKPEPRRRKRVKKKGKKKGKKKVTPTDHTPPTGSPDTQPALKRGKSGRSARQLKLSLSSSHLHSLSKKGSASGARPVMISTGLRSPPAAWTGSWCVQRPRCCAGDGCLDFGVARGAGWPTQADQGAPGRDVSTPQVLVGAQRHAAAGVLRPTNVPGRGAAPPPEADLGHLRLVRAACGVPRVLWLVQSAALANVALTACLWVPCSNTRSNPRDPACFLPFNDWSPPPNSYTPDDTITRWDHGTASLHPKLEHGSLQQASKYAAAPHARPRSRDRSSHARCCTPCGGWCNTLLVAAVIHCSTADSPGPKYFPNPNSPVTTFAAAPKFSFGGGASRTPYVVSLRSPTSPSLAGACPHRRVRHTLPFRLPQARRPSTREEVVSRHHLGRPPVRAHSVQPRHVPRFAIAAAVTADAATPARPGVHPERGHHPARDLYVRVASSGSFQAYVARLCSECRPQRLHIRGFGRRVTLCKTFGDQVR